MSGYNLLHHRHTRLRSLSREDTSPPFQATQTVSFGPYGPGLFCCFHLRSSLCFFFTVLVFLLIVAGGSLDRHTGRLRFVFSFDLLRLSRFCFLRSPLFNVVWAKNTPCAFLACKGEEKWLRRDREMPGSESEERDIVDKIEPFPSPWESQLAMGRNGFVGGGLRSMELFRQRTSGTPLS